MKSVAFAALLSLVVAMLAIAPQEAEAVRMRRGLPWGANNGWFHTIANGRVDWYWHWQDGRVPGAKVDFVPNLWGPRYIGLWAQRKSQMRTTNPSRILAMNEPDVPSQSNMSPSDAAAMWMQQLKPYQDQGTKVSSPQIVYDLNWMDSFMKILKSRGAEPDFMAIHWYGSWKSIDELKSFVTKVRKRYGKLIWLTEYGITASSHPSQQNVNDFHREATAWLESTGYVARAAWLGCFAVDNPPDSFASPLNAMFNSDGSLRQLAQMWMYNSYGGKSRRSIGDGSAADATFDASTPSVARRSPGALRSHAKLAQRMEARDQAAENFHNEAAEFEWQGEADHCTDLCKRRAQVLAEVTDGDAIQGDDLSATEEEELHGAL